MTEEINRRRKARLACMLAVQYSRGPGATSSWRPASVLDLTDLGCRLQVAEDLAGGMSVALRFDALLRDGAKSASIDTQAVVMWCRPHGGFAYEIGLEFLAAPPPGLNEILNAIDS